MKASFFLASAIFVCSYSFLNGMDESVKQKIEKLWQEYRLLSSEHSKQCFECGVCCPLSSTLTKSLRQIIANTVLDAGSLVSDQEKLNHIYGDDYYYKRKEIISGMIQRGINPNDIKYRFNDTPLYEAALFKDVEFGQFLIQNGAKPDKKTIEMAKPEFLAQIKK